MGSTHPELPACLKIATHLDGHGFPKTVKTALGSRSVDDAVGGVSVNFRCWAGSRHVHLSARLMFSPHRLAGAGCAAGRRLESSTNLVCTSVLHRK